MGCLAARPCIGSGHQSLVAVEPARFRIELIAFVKLIALIRWVAAA